MKKRLAVGVGACTGMLLLILDSRTALQGAYTGIDLCIRTVIPALFPFFVLSILLTGAFTGTSIPILRPLGRLCGIPRGAESILLTGLLGGYPVGAQAVSQSYREGLLNREDARRMLSFCSNAGPAFLFGMGAALFDSIAAPALLWGIHILSALAVGALMPGKSKATLRSRKENPVTLPEAMARSVKILGSVCGWVVLFRVIIAFLERWCLWMLPMAGQVILSGLLELTNGFCQLGSLQSPGLRFLLCTVFLGFGGLCVTMQTSAVTAPELGIRSYMTGKILQTCISLPLAAVGQFFLFVPQDRCSQFPALQVMPVVLGAALILFLREAKKSSSIPSAVGV